MHRHHFVLAVTFASSACADLGKKSTYYRAKKQTLRRSSLRHSGLFDGASPKLNLKPRTRELTIAAIMSPLAVQTLRLSTQRQRKLVEVKECVLSS